MSSTLNAMRWRTRYSFVFYVEKAHKFVLAMFGKPQSDLPHLTDQLARDIGMTPAELELHRFQLPSQSFRHPRI